MLGLGLGLVQAAFRRVAAIVVPGSPAGQWDFSEPAQSGQILTAGF